MVDAGSLSLTGNKLKIVLLAVVFNLFFEYSVGGVNRIFEKPGTIVVLFFIYFSLFCMLEDLIRRYRISNLQVFVFAWCFGILPELYLTGSIFTEPLILGINWVTFLTINIVWWGVLQSLLTFYFATRIVPRDWDQTTYMSWIGWGLCGLYMFIICAGSLLYSPTLRRAPVEGYLVASMFQLAGVCYLIYSLRGGRREKTPQNSSIILDILAFGTVIVFLGIGTFVAGTEANLQEGNMLETTALTYAAIWCFVVFAGVLLHYLTQRRPVPT